MSKETRVTMPQLGESVHEGTISRWLVKPGERVVEFEPMLEVDTDKVNAEVPSPVTGILKEIVAAEGQTVQAGAEIAVVELEDGAAAKPAAKPKESTPVKPAATEKTITQGAEPSAIQGPPARGVVETPGEGTAAAGASQPSPLRRAGGGEAPGYSPAVLMLAAEHKVDLTRIEGTGLGGRVTKKDVQRYIESGGAKAASAAAPQAGAAPAAPAARIEGDQVVPLTRVRKLIAEAMTRSKTTIPHAWQTQEVDMSGVVASRNAHKAKFQKEEGFGLTYLPYVIKAAATALREHPGINATFDDTQIIVHRDINIGVSVGLEDTLVVPVIRGTDGLSIAGIARAVTDVAERARNKKLKPDDLAGATFTVNNSGTFGTLFSYSVINPGQAGILTMEAIVERPVAVKGMIAVKPMMYLCFSFDHRVLDGLQAARYLVSARKWLESVTADMPIY